MCVPVFFRAVGSAILAIATWIVLVVKKKQKTLSKIECVLAIVLVLLCMSFSVKEFLHAVQPDIEVATLVLEDYSRAPKRLGTNFYFTGEDGQQYCLYVDTLTYRQYIGNDDLKKGHCYMVRYEASEKMIIEIEEKNKENHSTKD